MSKTKLIDSLTHELHKLNASIDVKIIEGRSYMSEAKRHKMLVKRLKEVNQKSWGRSWNFLSLL